MNSKIDSAQIALAIDVQILKIARSVQVYFPNLQDYRFKIQRTIRKFLNKTHEEDFKMLSVLPKGASNLFLDIGANRGDAIQSILMERPDAKVLAFEPNGLLIEKIKKIYKDDHRVEVYNFGIGNEPNQFDLYVPFYNNYMFDGLASFKEANASNWLKNQLYGYKNSKLCVKRIPCEVKRLDDFSLNPYFIKIDVQGFEYEVLLGAKKTIENSKPILLIETPGQNEVQSLTALGYHPFIYRFGKLKAGTKRYNVFFIPEHMIPALASNSLLSN
jgi:FkbM family methyltransferase